MNAVKNGVLRGLFTGFAGSGAVYEFVDGERWRQVCGTSISHRAFMPDARVVRENGKYLLEVEGVTHPAEVERFDTP